MSSLPEMSPICYLTRKEHFSSAHRLNAPGLSEQENKEIFGKCNHINGHGHNYELEVTIRGPINPITGMIYNIADLKACIKTCVLDVLDHRNLDIDVEYFYTRPSTTENLSVWIWQNLKHAFSLPQNVLLFEVKLAETNSNIVVYRGE